MMKYLYLIGALAFALGLSSCKKDEPQSSATVLPSPSEKTEVLTASHWSVEGTSEDGLESQILALDFRPDGTYTVTYRKATGTARSLRAQTARAISWEVYSFSGKYNLENDKLTILSIEYDRAEGVAADSPKIEEMKDFAQSLVGRVFRLNEEERTLTLTDEKPSPTAGEVTGPFRLFILHPATATATEPNSSLDSIILDRLIKHKWVMDRPLNYNGRLVYSLQFSEDGTYSYRETCEEIRVSTPGQPAGYRDYDLIQQGNYTYSHGIITLQHPTTEHHLKGEKKLYSGLSTIPFELEGMELRMGDFGRFLKGIGRHDDSDDRLEEAPEPLWFKLAPKEFSLTSGAWKFDDIEDRKRTQDKHSFNDGELYAFTFEPNGVFYFHYRIENFRGPNIYVLRPNYNNSYVARGSYSYQNKKVTILSIDTAFFIEPFTRYGQASASSLVGTVFRVDENRRSMRTSREDSYGIAAEFLKWEDMSIENHPTYLQIFSEEN